MSDDDFVNPALMGGGDSDDDGGFVNPALMGGGDSDDDGGFVNPALMGGGDSDDDGGFVNPALMGGGDSDDDGGFVNPALMGGGDSDDDGGFVNPAGGFGGGSEDDEEDEDGGGKPADGLDLLNSLLAGQDMEEATRKEPQPEPEPEVKPKKKNKRAGERKDPKQMMRELKMKQNAQDAGSPGGGGGGGGAGGAGGGDEPWPMRTEEAKFRTVVVDSACNAQWRIGFEGAVEPLFVSDGAGGGGAADEEVDPSRWDELEDFLEEHCERGKSASDFAVLFTVQALGDPAAGDGSLPALAGELAATALGDRFSFARCAVVSQEVLALYAHSLRSGLVLNLSDTATTAVPIFEGALLAEGARREPAAPTEGGAAAATPALLDLVLAAVLSCPIDTRSELFGNLVLTGARALGWSDAERSQFERSLRRRFRNEHGGVIKGRRARAVHDFVAEQVGELNLEKGDIVIVDGQRGEWFYGSLEDASSEYGLFPQAFVDQLEWEHEALVEEPDCKAVIKKQYRDKYGAIRYKDNPAQFSFLLSLPTPPSAAHAGEGCELTAWVGGSVLASTAAWPELWCTSAEEVASKCPVLPMDSAQAAHMGGARPCGSRGLPLSFAAEPAAEVLTPADALESWAEWLEDYHEKLLDHPSSWFFINSPESSEHSGSRFEDLSTLEKADRFGEVLPEAARLDHFLTQRRSRVAELRDAMSRAQQCAREAQAAVGNGGGWQAVVKAQSSYGDIVAKEYRVSVSSAGGGFGASLKESVEIKWYGCDAGEPTVDEIKDHVCKLWQMSEAAGQDSFETETKLYLVETDDDTLVTALRGVSGKLCLSDKLPESAREEVNAGDSDETDSDEDEISYDELPANVQGMSIFDQIAWKKAEIARRKAARAARNKAKSGGGSGMPTFEEEPAPQRAGDASAALLDGLLGSGGGDGAVGQDDSDADADASDDDMGGATPAWMSQMDSGDEADAPAEKDGEEQEEDEEDGGGLNPALFGALMSSAAKTTEDDYTVAGYGMGTDEPQMVDSSDEYAPLPPALAPACRRRTHAHAHTIHGHELRHQPTTPNCLCGGIHRSDMGRAGRCRLPTPIDRCGRSTTSAAAAAVAAAHGRSITSRPCPRPRPPCWSARRRPSCHPAPPTWTLSARARSPFLPPSLPPSLSFLSLCVCLGEEDFSFLPPPFPANFPCARVRVSCLAPQLTPCPACDSYASPVALKKTETSEQLRGSIGSRAQPTSAETTELQAKFEELKQKRR
jgi:hypothetical protein